jgi:hypothetical protein
LEFAQRHACLFKEPGIEGSKVFAWADDYPVRRYLPMARCDDRSIDRECGLRKSKLDTISFLQETREFCNDLTGVHADFRFAEDGPLTMFRPDKRIPLPEFLTRKLVNAVPVGLAHFQKLAENLRLYLVESQLHASAPIKPEPRIYKRFQPNLSTSEGDIQEFAWRLSDRPHHSEVSDARPHRGRMPLQDEHALTRFRRKRGVSQPHDPGTDHEQIHAFHGSFWPSL